MTTMMDWVNNPMRTLFQSVASVSPETISPTVLATGAQGLASEHEYLTALASGAAIKAAGGSLVDAAIASYGAHEVATGDANMAEKAAFAWALGNVAENTAAKMGGSYLTQKFAGWAATVGAYIAAGQVSDSIQAAAEEKAEVAAAPARGLRRDPG